MEVSVGSEAPAFLSQLTPEMSPLKGICSDFQLGSCKNSDHHRTEDGEMRLHVCQPCFQSRDMFVDHCCDGINPSDNLVFEISIIMGHNCTAGYTLHNIFVCVAILSNLHLCLL